MFDRMEEMRILFDKNSADFDDRGVLVWNLHKVKDPKLWRKKLILDKKGGASWNQQMQENKNIMDNNSNG